MANIFDNVWNTVQGIKKKAQTGIQNWATQNPQQATRIINAPRQVAQTYQKISPYVPFAPQINTPQRIQQNWSPVVNKVRNTPLASVLPGGQQISNVQRMAGQKPITVGDIGRMSTPQGQQQLLREKGGDMNQYLVNRYGAPISQIPYNYKQLTSPKSTLGQRAYGALGLAGGAFTLMPDPIGDVAMPAYDFLKGYSASQKRGGTLKQNLVAGKKSFTLEKPVGLGTAISTDPTKEMAFNIGEFPVMLLAGGKLNKKFSGGWSKEQLETVRNGFTPEVRGIVGRFTQMVEENPNINKKNLGQLGEYVHSLGETVFGKEAANLTNKQLKNAFDNIMQVADRGGGIREPFTVGLGTQSTRDVLKNQPPVEGGVSKIPNTQWSLKNKGLDTVYHETSPKNAVDLLHRAGDLNGMYVATSPEQAIGQKAKGALIEFDTTTLEGTGVNKPNVGFTGQQEYKILEGTHGNIVKSITLKPDTLLDPTTKARILNATTRMGENNWIKETLPDGSVKLTNPIYKSPSVVEGGVGGGGVPPNGKKYANVQEYINEQTGRQNTKKPFDFSQVKKNLKKSWVESFSPLIDPINEAAKKNKFEILPGKNIDDQISRVLASDTIASRFLKDNGFEQSLLKAGNLDNLSEYLKAKHSIEVSTQGLKTGRNLEMDKRLVAELGPKYEQSAQTVNNLYRKLTQMAEDNGLIKKGTTATLSTKYPDYVRFERIFSPEETQTYAGKGKGVASLSTQTAVQKMTGSERAIENPLSSLINRSYKVINEIERNKAASILTEYRNIPGNPYGLSLVKQGENAGTNTISIFRNGQKEIWNVNKDVADAAKNLNREQMNTWVKVLTTPIRVFKSGTTTLRLPFVASNVAKDQLTGFINSDKAASTSLLNPKNTVQSLFEAVKHGDTYKQMERSGAIQTSFDIYREQPKITLGAIKAKQKLGSRIKFKVTHPQELLRSYEDILARGEELTRIQQYKGTYDALIKQGRTVQDAQILASRAARQNTVDFQRYGELGKVVNWFIPYFNAGVQGSRSFLRSGQRDPVGTGAKLASAVFLPMIASTLWNIATPDRKQAYDDIQDWEKESNFIIIPPNPTKDEQGRWNVTKIPMSQEVSNLANISRLLTEKTQNPEAKLAWGKIAADLIGTTTSVDITAPGNLIPYPFKPGIESMANYNFYTKKPIVPQWMTSKLPEQQVYPWTSGVIRGLAKPLNMSPIKLQHLIKGYGGQVATDVIGQVDKGLASAGVIPQSQAQGAGIEEQITSRFTKAVGGTAYQNLKAKDQLRLDAINSLLTGNTEDANKIIKENDLKITKKSLDTKAKTMAVNAMFDGDNATVKDLYQRLGVKITFKDAQKEAKDRAVLALQQNNKEEANKLIKQYNLKITRKDVYGQ